jgi:hypothetical protein
MELFNRNGFVAPKSLKPISEVETGLQNYYNLNPTIAASYDEFISKVTQNRKYAATIFKEAGLRKPFKSDNYIVPIDKMKPIPGTSVKIKSLANGGTPYSMMYNKSTMSGIKTNAKEIPMGNAIKLKGAPNKTDGIKANIDGQPVNLDHNEIVIRMSDGTPVVLSADLGQDKQYTSLLSRGFPQQQVNDVMGRKAIATQKSMSNGADGWTPYVPNIKGEWKQQDPYIFGSEFTTADKSTFDFGSSDNLNTISNLGLLGLNTINNAVAANKANKAVRPTPRTFNPVMLDENVNNPIYEKGRADINAGYTESLNTLRENTSNSNTFTAKAGLLGAQRQTLLGGVGAQEAAFKGNIDNSNKSLLNSATAGNIQMLNADAQLGYEDKLSRINTTHGLYANTLQGAQAFVNSQMAKVRDEESMKMIAKSFDIDWYPGMTTEQLYHESFKKMKKNLGIE